MIGLQTTKGPYMENFLARDKEKLATEISNQPTLEKLWREHNSALSFYIYQSDVKMRNWVHQ